MNSRKILRCAIVAGVLLSCGAGQAQERDIGYYDVVDVASDDVLNIRAQPNTASEIIGSLAPDATNIEVISTEGNWGMVIAGEGNGWVSLTHLTRSDPEKIGQTRLPVGLSCTGTEPFWSLELGAEAFVFEHFDAPGQEFEPTGSGSFHNSFGQAQFLTGANDDAQMTAVIEARFCSDGMSDRNYGWAVDLVMTGTTNATGYGGCCQLPRD